MGQKNCLHALDYNSAEIEPIWMNLGHCGPNAGGWHWQILDAMRAVATVWKEAEILLVYFYEIGK